MRNLKSTRSTSLSVWLKGKNPMSCILTLVTIDRSHDDSHYDGLFLLVLTLVTIDHDKGHGHVTES